MNIQLDAYTIALFHFDQFQSENLLHVHLDIGRGLEGDRSFRKEQAKQLHLRLLHIEGHFKKLILGCLTHSLTEHPLQCR